jgi:hypothetical protein
MKRIFENLFYRTYLVALTNKSNTHHLDSTIMMFCIFQALNFIGIILWFEYFKIYTEHIEKYKLLIWGLIWNMGNFLYFYKYFESIKARYSNETVTQKRNGYILWFVYVLISVVFIALPIYLLKK